MTQQPGERRKHLLLVGLPGSGKSTVGAIAADLLKVPFVDVDREIERTIGAPVATIFQEQGEAHFRALESESVRVLLNRNDPILLAPGGGWAAQPGNLQLLADRRICLYLVTSPQIAVARASRGMGRPLLPRGQELSAMEELLMNRERYYAHADLQVRTDHRQAIDVASEVAELARMNGAL